jgi:hypothetical protein
LFVAVMKKLKIFAVAVPLAFPVLAPSAAQEYGRLQVQYVDQFYDGYVDQFYNGSIDGRPNHNEGLPPSAADKGNGIYDNPVAADDCREVEMFAPDARPGWQARVGAACGV